jgi:DNA mismatch repair protein MutS2
MTRNRAAKRTSRSLREYLQRLAEGRGADELIHPRRALRDRSRSTEAPGAGDHGPAPADKPSFEPLETIDQNNELVRLLDEAMAEIHRILLEMTRRIGEHSEPILKAVDVLGELELQFAKARFAEDYNCVPVLMLGNDSVDRQEPRGESRSRLSGPNPARLVLIKARHSLL